MIRSVAFVLILFCVFPAVSFVDAIGQRADGDHPENEHQPAVLQEQDPQEFDEQQLDFFESKVRPILVERCFECHGPDNADPDGGLSLASRAGALAGGDTDPAIVPGDPDESLMIEAINYEDIYEMPPDSKLPDDEIAILTEWVEMGAPWPASDEAVVAAESFDIEKLKAEHWCWQPVANPAVPVVKDPSWPVDSIDNFVLAGLDAAGLKPAGDVNRRSLLRRLSFDITGLPPTRDEINAFVNDQSDDAVEKVVDRLLASPRFGEHWARHWMDLTRYAETGGHEFDYPIPNAWRYRDYLIRAFNEDVSYDQFIYEHVAGDLIENPRMHPEEEFNESILGTGFWFLGEDFHAPVDVRADQVMHFDNQIDVMCKTFLGLTVACARCHDHKFDAISTDDFYALAGFLKSSRRQNVMLDPGRRIQNAFDSAAALQSDAQSVVATFNEAIDKAATEDFRKLEAGEDVDLKLYLVAALKLLRDDPNWGQRETTVFEGEDLKDYKVSGGECDPQELEPRTNFSWRHDKQLFWRSGQDGDTLKFEVEVPVGDTCRFDLYGCFTQAVDYGIITIALNGEVVSNSKDYFNSELTTTGRRHLGEIELKDGNAKFVCTIVGHNEDAIPRRMFGIDYLEFEPVRKITGTPLTAKRVARDLGIEEALVARLVEALKSSALSSTMHPLHVLQKLSRTQFVSGPVKDRKTLSEQLEAARQRMEQAHRKSAGANSNDDSVLFADFTNGIPDGWFKTGVAFESNESPSISATGNISPQSVSSGVHGRNFQGVLRSPTFTIEHDTVHYRVAGENSVIRVVVEGHWMDLYNPLLFKGLKTEIKRPADGSANLFRPVVQNGDLKLQRGHRAHIEIADEGEGWIAIEEIRFAGNGSKRRQVSSLTDALNSLLKPGVENADSILDDRNCASVAAKAITELIAKGGNGKEDLINWLAEHDLGGLFNGKIGESLSEMKAIRDRIREVSATAPAPMTAPGLTEGTPEDEFVLIRGNHKTPGEIVDRRFLTAISSPVEYKGSGRLQLARQIASAENPLTSRVIANRIWHHLFGRGIVASVDNFGVLGNRPTHPELLDHLATGFSSDGWSIKRFIRRLVLTRTYQMASVASADTSKKVADVDPDNLLLHRANVRRITAQSMRDSMLMVSGRLDEKMFGSPVATHLTDFMQGRGRPGESGPLDGDGRRSIYVSVRRNFLSPLMLAFDSPIPLNSIGRRNNSNVPAQALILMNDPLVIELAGSWARQLIENGESTDARLAEMFETAFGRPPTKDQIKDAGSFLRHQAEELGVEPDQIDSSEVLWSDLCHVLFNVKQFIYLD